MLLGSLESEMISAPQVVVMPKMNLDNVGSTVC